MKPLDRWVMQLRIAQALPHVPERARLLDVGCYDGTLLRRAAARLRSGLGLDPDAAPFDEGVLRVRRGRFPEDLPAEAGPFDCVTMLAVLEHLPDPPAVARACHEALAPGGRVVLTVPAPVVDRILEVGMALRILDGMDAEHHHGFDPRETLPAFRAAGFALRLHRRFELGLNHLYVFEREDGPRDPRAPGTHDGTPGSNPRSGGDPRTEGDGPADPTRLGRAAAARRRGTPRTLGPAQRPDPGEFRAQPAAPGAPVSLSSRALRRARRRP